MPGLAEEVLGTLQPGATASLMHAQVRENVRTALSPMTDKEREVLKGVEDILAPVKNVGWPSGLPENN